MEARICRKTRNLYFIISLVAFFFPSSFCQLTVDEDRICNTYDTNFCKQDVNLVIDSKVKTLGIDIERLVYSLTNNLKNEFQNLDGFVKMLSQNTSIIASQQYNDRLEVLKQSQHLLSVNSSRIQAMLGFLQQNLNNINSSNLEMVQELSASYTSLESNVSNLNLMIHSMSNSLQTQNATFHRVLNEFVQCRRDVITMDAKLEDIRNQTFSNMINIHMGLQKHLTILEQIHEELLNTSYTTKLQNPSLFDDISFILEEQTRNHTKNMEVIKDINSTLMLLHTQHEVQNQDFLRIQKHIEVLNGSLHNVTNQHLEDFVIIPVAQQKLSQLEQIVNQQKNTVISLENTVLTVSQRNENTTAHYYQIERSLTEIRTELSSQNRTLASVPKHVIQTDNSTWLNLTSDVRAVKIDLESTNHTLVTMATTQAKQNITVANLNRQLDLQKRENERLVTQLEQVTSVTCALVSMVMKTGQTESESMVKQYIQNALDCARNGLCDFKNTSLDLSLQLAVCGMPQGCNTTALGLQSGLIPDSAMNVSEMYAAAYKAGNGRLYNARGWYTKTVTRSTYVPGHHWLKIDLGKLCLVNGVATQGGVYGSWVTSYTVWFSLDGATWTQTKHNGVNQIFPGNTDKNSVVTNTFSTPIRARHIQIKVQRFSGSYVAMRAELYGCAL